MGCWNGTCLISNLPIMAGEPIVGFTIKYEMYSDAIKDYSGTCYATDYAKPFGLPIYGTYDDYGGIKDVCENSITIKYLSYLFNKSNVKELLNCIEQDQIEIKSNILKKNVGVGLVMINRSIFDCIISSHIKNDYDPDKDKIISGLKNIRNKNIVKYPTISKKDYDDLLDIFSLASQLNVSVGILEEQDYNDMIKFIVAQNNDEVDKEFAELLYNKHILCSEMYSLRKLWIGPSGKGAQNRNYRSHLVLAEAIKEHIFNSFDSPEDVYCNLLGERDW